MLFCVENRLIEGGYILLNGDIIDTVTPLNF